jgi:hypothetical protein
MALSRLGNNYHNERETLGALAPKCTSSYRDVVRAKIILYAPEGLSINKEV